MRLSNMENDTIVVTFSGDNVSDGELTPAASPVVLQMDGGGGEYSAVKYTTASISILCDGVQHLDLYAVSPLDVSVQVYNDTTDRSLFLGYVTPNTFAQPINGVNDTLTIECVDLLGIAKFIPFDIGVNKVLTLAEIFAAIAERLGIPDKWSICRNVRLTSGDGSRTTTEYQKLTIPTRFFYEGISPSTISEGVVSLLPQAMTLFDALKMIAESFRATWLQITDTLYLFDEVTCRAQGATPYIDNTGWVATLGGTKELTEESFAATASQISVLPRYSMVSLARKRAKELDLLPALFENGNLASAEGEFRYHDDKNGSNERMTVVQALTSKVCDVANGGGFYSYAELTPPKNKAWSDAWQIAARGDESKWTNYFRIPANDDGSALARIALNVSPEFVTALPERAKLGLRLKITAAFSADTSRIYPYKLNASSTYRLYALLKVVKPDGSELYYNEFAEVWQEQKRLIGLTFPSYTAAEWRDFFVAAFFSDGEESVMKYPVADVLAIGSPGGKVEIELYASPKGSGVYNVCYIKELSLQAVVLPDVRAVGVKDTPSETSYLGTYDYNNTLDTVTLPIDVRETLGSKFFGTVIDGEELLQSRAPGDTVLNSKRWEVQLQFDDGRGGTMSMLERIAAMVKCGDGMEYELELCDEHNSAYSPLTRVISSAWQGGKVIAGYSRDVEQSTIRVTLN